jgi:hypothetical protein
MPELASVAVGGPDARHRSERAEPEPIAHQASVNDGVVLTIEQSAFARNPPTRVG